MRPRSRQERAPAWGFLSLALLSCLSLACGPEPGARSSLPEGAYVSGSAEALGLVLGRLTRLEGTPLSRAATQLRKRLERCDSFVGSAPDGKVGALLDSLRCTGADPEPPAVRALRGRDDLALLLPFGNGARLVGSLAVGPAGGVTLEGRIELTGAGAVRLLLPDSSRPTPAVLNPDQTLLHARLRPEGGIDIAGLVPEGSQGDRLFRLKSDLFAGAVLEGTWEAAVYLPQEGSRMTPMALALDYRMRTTAVAAMEAFVRELERTWPVHRSPFRVGAWDGACLLDLRILPEFAPCYVATDRALVVGWNPTSVRLALAASRVPGDAPSSGVVVHLDRFGEADRRLREAFAPDLPPLDLDYAWHRIVARSWKEQGHYRVRVAALAEGS